ncbi:SMI1/KNR4 family protein [Xanthomonas sp. NCPPB 2654]|uniref:SMI1/KNR4 family protein n=1 Tax=unclassified Xanthomonas TaxID=2643310 RepID=UPI0021E052A3|nr:MULTISPECIES: SMI1/KNR4 family protein [unclassified Xanthomonas]MDL5364630.1 SMI1/KNR4 family protein [Xanthomonas sp. NCPPB 2654]UYC21944.1 SMI1/KNR4 family protein [Xanthomonas sp. CFBP 8443]
MLDAFESIAADAGFALPPLLADWYRRGLTTLADDTVPALGSDYDIEWLDPPACRQTIDEWLNPQAQQGIAFFPFAQSGAGDAYCLVRLPDQRHGVACVWHDADDSTLQYASFDAFVAARFTHVFADLGAVPVEGLDVAEVAQFVQQDVARCTEAMEAPLRELLRQQSRLPVQSLDYRSGPKARPETVDALIPQAVQQAQLASLELASPVAFAIVPRWELE